jgi:hypothetical protein
MSSSTNTKVNELFRVMHESELTDGEYRAYAAMLRELLNKRVVSGRMLVTDFLDNHRSWTNALVNANHADADVQDFYQFLVWVFSPPSAPALNEPATQGDSNHPAQANQAPESTQATHACARKKKWLQLMRPLAAEFASKSLSADTIVEFIWEGLTDNGALSALYATGSALMSK